MPAEVQLKIYREPLLKNPRLVLAWGCIGQVGIDAVTYLRDKLGAQEFAHIEPCDFFTPAIEVENGLVSGLELPQSRFYSWENSDGDDLILFIGDREPSLGRYEYANLLLEVGQRFHVPGIYTICAFPSSISHTAEPKVPPYATGRANPKSCRAVLQVLNAMLGLDIDLAEFDPLIEQAEKEIGEMMKEASWAFIKNFTIDYGDLFQGEEH